MRELVGFAGEEEEAAMTAERVRVQGVTDCWILLVLLLRGVAKG